VAIEGLLDTDWMENIVQKGEIAFRNFTFFQNVSLKLFVLNFFYYWFHWGVVKNFLRSGEGSRYIACLFSTS
jgi:hypothetical protein